MTKLELNFCRKYHKIFNDISFAITYIVIFTIVLPQLFILKNFKPTKMLLE